MNFRLLACALGLGFLLSGCAGYQLGGQKPGHLAGVTKLAVPAFENLSLEPRLGALVTNAVIKQIQLTGAYEIVNEADAEAVLTGRIVRIRRSQFRSDRDNVLRTSQLLLTLSTDYTIRDSGGGSILHRGAAAADSYTVLDRNVQNSEAQALEDAAQRLAANIATDLSEGW
ncbi:MAG TPA: LPS assembly lipoprotein LptE [Prosthecobacter sp.]|nr:LPS assembly lipoprotein LptE [Prosthecobacter sp.]HRK16770.1 LPS assembly lipoprotein LptE [Prosthecobacter sp.]